MSDINRDPERLLSRLQDDELKSKRGRFKIFLGYVAGVGKTYTMLYWAQIL